MTRRYRRLAWTAAVCTYLLIIFGAVVRITGSGLGCGEDWPLCNGKLLPPLDLPTLIEYGHRLVAAALSVLVVAVAGYAWWLRKGVGREAWERPGRTAYVALGLLVVQVLLGAVTVKLALPPWTVILHLGAAMLLLAALIVAASPRSRAAVGAAALCFVTVLFGALTANTGAASACLGFPLCNGQFLPAGNYLQHLHWTHRLLAYGLTAYVAVWALRTKRPGALAVLGLVAVQVSLAAFLVLQGLPPALQAAHVAVGTGVWAALVIVAQPARPSAEVTRGEAAPAAPAA